MITSILDNSDPERPPIIILQSDHGARNILNKDIDFKHLENYPKEYAYHIINTIYNPYCDDSQLAQDMDPINTFPIIFNCIFNDNIPMK
jgi:hypothetical protein